MPRKELPSGTGSGHYLTRSGSCRRHRAEGLRAWRGSRDLRQRVGQGPALLVASCERAWSACSGNPIVALMGGWVGAEAGDGPEGDPVRLLRTAVSSAVEALGRTGAGGSAAKQALAPVAATIRLVQPELIEAAEADPFGPLAAALACLLDANDRLDNGDPRRRSGSDCHRPRGPRSLGRPGRARPGWCAVELVPTERRSPLGVICAHSAITPCRAASTPLAATLVVWSPLYGVRPPRAPTPGGVAA